MTRALLIIDVQNDFTAKAADGSAVAREITEYVRANRGVYQHVIASRDWHDGDNDNGGHFPPAQSGVGWVSHCVAESAGAEYDPLLDQSLVDIHIKKGQGFPGYSIFEGTDDAGRPFPAVADELGITEIDVVGIATEFCVAAAADDAATSGIRSRVLLPLCRGFSGERIALRLGELRALGVAVVEEVRS